MNNSFQIVKNKYWEQANPFFSVITPVFNRKEVLPRTFASIESQIFRDFEYIIVNDGSTESLDDVVLSFLNSTTIPVLYIKKTNGGVHTARNAAVPFARGTLTTWLDSDDEFYPETLQTFRKTWEAIPSERKQNLFQISARCMEAGNDCGSPFPENINELEKDEAYRIDRSRGKGNLRADITGIMKDNPWPEPEGITFVGEDVLWDRLEQKYSTWFINDVLLIYHTEGDDHIFSSRKKKNDQYIANCLWSLSNHLNDWNKLRGTALFLDSIFKYELFIKIYKRHTGGPVRQDFRLRGFRFKLFGLILYVPAFLGSYIYEFRKM